MSFGCDFVCQNPSCVCFGKRLTIHGPWLLGSIDDVLRTRSYRTDQDGRASLLKKKSEGRTFACIPIPNSDNVKPVGIRLQHFCPTCRIMWDDDLPRPPGISDAQEAKLVEDSKKLPFLCRACLKACLSYEEMSSRILQCPGCGKPTESNEWFSQPEGSKGCK